MVRQWLMDECLCVASLDLVNSTAPTLSSQPDHSDSLTAPLVAILGKYCQIFEGINYSATTVTLSMVALQLALGFATGFAPSHSPTKLPLSPR